MEGGKKWKKKLNKIEWSHICYTFSYKKFKIMKMNHFEKLLKGVWELENGGPVVELGADRKMSLQSNEKEATFSLEEEEGMLLLTIPSVIEKSEVLNISPTELVVKEFEQGTANSKIRTFRRISES